VEVHAEVASADIWRPRLLDWRDVAAALLIFGILFLLAVGARQMTAPLAVANLPEISLSPWLLPYYTLRTVMRMLVALLASLFFTFNYATLAAKSRRAEIVLIPILDVFQSVPILGYLSFTVLFFVSFFPGNMLGPELAAIFAIFTSQAWNMAFSFYQSLRTIPTELDEASRSLRSSSWQRFWQLEVPFAMPGLIWNMMMSMSGGWFFVVASEAISVGRLQFALPGVGSYVATAIQHRDLAAVGFAIAAMTIAIVLYDQLLFRPMVAWADKFRSEQTAAQVASRSWVLDLFRRSKLMARIDTTAAEALHRAARARLVLPSNLRFRLQLSARAMDNLWYGLIGVCIAYVIWALLR
jgi:NitT/TauT family transport system permease protein